MFSCGFRGVLATKEGEDRGTARAKTLNPIIVWRTTHLVVMWCCDKNDRTIPGDVEGTSRTYLSEEDTCDGAPEDERGLVGNVRRKGERFLAVRHGGRGVRFAASL